MDVKFGKLAARESGLSRLNVTAPDSTRKKIADILGSSSGDTSRVTSEPARVSTLLLASNAKSFMDVAAAAAKSITDQRSRQLELAKEAASISDPEKQATLGSEISAIETEIARTAQNATFNGQNALQGGGVTIIETDKLYTAVQSADLSVLAQNPNISVSNQTNATSAVTTLKQTLLSARKATDGVEVAQSKAEDTLEETIDQVNLERETEGGLNSIESAEDLAKKVAQEITELFQPENSDREIIASNLDPERVNSLLSD